MKKITLSLLIGAMALVSCSPNVEETVEVPTTDSTATVVESDTTVSAQSDSTVVDTAAVGA